MRFLLLLQHSGQAARLEPLMVALSRLGHDSVVMLEQAKRPGVKNGEWCLPEAARAGSGGRIKLLPVPAAGGAVTRRAAAGAARLPWANRFVVGRIASELATLDVDLVLTCPPADRMSGRRLAERAGRRLGLPHAVLVDSRTDLLAHGLESRPHALYVWNEAQATAAKTLNDLPAARVVVTGAPAFDRVLGRQPSTERTAFCAANGLNADLPFYVLIAGADLLADVEPGSIFERARDLRRVGGIRQLLVRAYDRDRLKSLQSAPKPPADLAGSLVWTSHETGQDNDADPRIGYVDALHHSAGVLSADEAPLLDAAVLGRPAYLLKDDDGSLEAATGGTVQRAAGSGALPPCSQGREKLLALLRPRGHDEPVAPLLALELATLATRATRRRSRLRAFPTPPKAKRPRAQPLPAFRARMDAELDLLRFDLQRATRGDASVLAGPFSTEVGFELLYWIPFLRWAVDEVPGLSERLVVVSRGGTASWSADVAAGYADLYDVAPPTEILERRNSQKQRTPTGLDRDLLERVRERLGLEAPAELHPSLFFEFYYRVMKCDQRSFARSVTPGPRGAEGLAARYGHIAPPSFDGLDELLPNRFVAVRFYSRPSFPNTAENRRFIIETIGHIARSQPVVLLNNGLELDEHVDFDAPEESVITIDHLMKPSSNLQLQTAVLARAQAFVGTYGGLAYLAPHLGVPALTFSSLTQHTHAFHLDLAEHVFQTPGFGSLVMLNPADLELIELVTGRLAAQR